MITKAFYDKMNYFVGLRRFTPQDAKEMEAAIRMTFNPNYTLCTHCRAAIQHGQVMIKNWLELQTIMEDITHMVETEEPLFDMPIPQTIVDEIEAEKQGCTKCKRKRQNKG
jgi:hypothetical protein